MKNRIKSNEGIALITVVIGVMFCLLLSSTMLRISLLGLQSRTVNNEMNNTFYDAESVMDSARMNLQRVAAEAWVESNHDDGSPVAYLDRLFVLLTGRSQDITKVNGSISLTDKDREAIISILQTDATVVSGGKVTTVQSIDVSKGKESEYDGLILRGVEISFEDPKTGMVSYIKSDIKIGAPVYASDKSYPVGSYSMFAGSGATLWSQQGVPQAANENQLGFYEQKGNVYIGYEKMYNTKEADSLFIGDSETFILSGDSVIINGNVLCTGKSNFQVTAKNVEIRGMILLGPGSHFVISKDSNILCRDIRTFSSDANVKYNGTGYESVAEKTMSRDASNTKMYDKGVPYNYYSPNSATPNHLNGNPYWGKNNTRGQIVYIEGSSCYDAYVADGKVTTQNSEAISRVGGLTVNMEDPKLYPAPNKSYANSGTTLYDQVFASIVDTAYFYQWMKNGHFQNPKVEKRLGDTQYKENPDGSFSYIAGSALSDGPGDKGPTKYEYADKQTVDTKVLFYPVTSSEIVNVSNNVFYVTSGNITINVDTHNAEYTGIYITTGKVAFKNDTGYTASKSFLQMDTTSDHKYLKGYINTIGKYVGQSSNVQNTIFNNMFKGGIKSFYADSKNSSEQILEADKETNGKMDLIDTLNFEKR